MAKKKPATLSDVATTVGVAPMGVSRVINGSGHVSEQTIEMVMDAGKHSELPAKWSCARSKAPALRIQSGW